MPCADQCRPHSRRPSAPPRVVIRPRTVRVAHRDYWLADSRPEEWLLIEWPDGEKEPIKYWLSTLPEDVAFRQLVDIAKLRWRIERDYQELTVGLDILKDGAGAASTITPPLHCGLRF